MKILLIIFLFGFGCKTVEQDCPGCEEPEEVALVLITDHALKAQFEDGTKVEKVWRSAGFFYREGSNKGDCRLSRTSVAKADDGLVFMRLNGITETCSGVSCEHCAFKDTGGCTCKNVLQGVCTHTISRNRNMLRMQ